MKGKFDYGMPGKVVENQPAHHALLGGPRLLSVPEPRPLVHHRGHPLGQVRDRLRHQGADRQGQPRGSLARSRQGAGRSGRRYPDVERRAARRPSSTARSSIPKIRARISRASASSASKSDLSATAPRAPGATRARRIKTSSWRRRDMNMPAVNPSAGARASSCPSRKVLRAARRRAEIFAHRARLAIVARDRGARSCRRSSCIALILLASGNCSAARPARRCRRRRASSTTPGS